VLVPAIPGRVLKPLPAMQSDPAQEPAHAPDPTPVGFKQPRAARKPRQASKPGVNSQRARRLHCLVGLHRWERKQFRMWCSTETRSAVDTSIATAAGSGDSAATAARSAGHACSMKART
jgi:hypothetical protein